MHLLSVCCLDMMVVSSTWLILIMTAQAVFVVPALTYEDVIAEVLADKLENDCESDLCSVCSVERAVCNTYSLDEVVPQKVTSRSLSFRYLNANYSCRATLKFEHFQSYDSLIELRISGDIIGIEEDAFMNLKALQLLLIRETLIEHLPDQLISYNLQLTSLRFYNNLVSTIPTQLVKSEHKIVSFEIGACFVILQCVDGYPVLPEVMQSWTHLTHLDISKMLIDYDRSNCTYNTVGDNFFQSVKQVQSLTADNAEVFSGSQKLLNPLERLVNLSLSGVLPYKNCPAQAQTLFESLPSSLQYLTIERWDGAQNNKACELNETTFNIFAKPKPRFQSLSTRFSKSIFGAILKRPFINRSEIKRLDLGYCGLYHAYVGALPHSAELNIDGNGINTNSLRIDNQRTSSFNGLRLQVLSIRQTALISNHNEPADLSSLLLHHPNLTELDFSGNYVTMLPYMKTIFSTFDDNPQETQIKVLKANDNRLISLTTMQSSLCTYLPRLQKLYLENNRLESVTDLNRGCTTVSSCGCRELSELYLQDNRLGKNMKENGEGIQELVALTVLDLSRNLIKHLDSIIFSRLVKLKRLYLADNELYKFDMQSFTENARQLRILDLSWNALGEFSTDMISSATSLRQVKLNGNLVSSLDQASLDLITRRQLDVYLSDNPLDCRCDQRYFQSWLLTTTRVIDKGRLRCSVGHTGQLVLEYNHDLFECTIKPILIPVVSVLAGILVAMALGYPCYKYRWYITHLRIVARAVISQLQQAGYDRKCPYDAFVSYAKDDETERRWVVDTLVPKLEQTDGGDTALKLYIEARDAMCGSDAFSERCDALDSCRKIIIVASNSYLKSCYCLSEAELAGMMKHGSGNSYQPNRILVLVREELEEEIITAPMTALLVENVIHVDTNSERKLKRIWVRIRNFLSEPKFVYERRRKGKKRRGRQQLVTEQPSAAHSSSTPSVISTTGV